MKDLHTKVKQSTVIAPVAVGTTGTGQTGKVIDTAGYGGVEFVIGYGSITATNATLTPVMKEGDATGSLTSVADADMLGTEALAGIAAAARTSGSTKNVHKRVGYRGNKRYVNLSISSTVTAGTLIDVVAVLHSPAVASTSNP